MLIRTSFVLVLSSILILFTALPLRATEQEDKLTATDAAGADQFGIAVAIDGTTALVGAHQHEDTADVGDDYGAAYIFERDTDGSGNWTERVRLLPSNRVLSANFGNAVALDGDRALVGAYRGNGSVGGAQGAAYIFERNQDGTDQWGEVTPLTAITLEQGDNFGYSVALDGDRALVGAYHDDDAGLTSGSAYLFERDGEGEWNQVIKLVGDDTAAGDLFGSTVAISGNTLMVGAPEHDHGGSNTGSVYVFELYEGEWIQVAELRDLDPEPGARFGDALALDGSTAVIGAYDTDVGEEQNAGGAYIYERNPDGLPGWLQTAELVASDAASGDNLGFSVAIRGSTVLVGAPGDDSAMHQGGAAYFFQRDRGGPDQWGQVLEIFSDDIDSGDDFGHAVALTEGYALVGAFSDDDDDTGSGSAYVFTVDPATSPTLTIATGIPGVPDEPVAVPVVSNADGAMLVGTTFSIDYDATCLDFDPSDDDFDGIPDDFAFQTPPTFEITVAFDLADDNGEIDVTVLDPLETTFLADGTLATLTFTPTCVPMLAETLAAPVLFSTDPQVSFRDDEGLDFPGHGQGGSVEIFSGVRGDCNADGLLSAADLDAFESEVFDDDGPSWLDVPGGAFVGSSVGCDANGDTQVDAGDLTCRARLLAGATCTQAASGLPGIPSLGLPYSLTVEDGALVVEIDFDPAGHAITGLVFSLDLDLARVAFDPTDANLDGLPDTIELLDPAIARSEIRFDRANPEGELQIALADPAASPTPFADGPLLRVRLLAFGAVDTLEGAIIFGTAPDPSFGDSEGRSILGTAGFAAMPLFEDGFESGGVGEWSSSVGFF